MDFGIAAQLNSNDLTQTNSVMGTGYYLPPEQANGSAATIKSDIYSLGILMYELVTGRVPFKGDSPVEVAIKQMKEKIPSIVEQDPDMPQSIENIILRACAKNPKNRYDSVVEMNEDLKTALDKSRFNEPKVVYKYPESNFDEDDENIVKEKRSDRNKEKENDKKDKKLNKSVKILIIIASLLVIGLVFAFFIYPRFISKPSVEVPDVEGMTQTKAESVLEEAGFEVAAKTDKETSDEIEEGRVIETDPAAGRTIKKGTTITLVVSSGSEKITIEDYTGKNYYEIKAKLEAAGVEVQTETKDVPESDNAEENVVLSQDVEPGEKLGKGDTIVLTIPNIYTVYPDFAAEGYSLVDLKSFCTDNDLTLEVNYQEDISKKDGTIIYQNMAAGTKVSAGATLRITMIQNSSDASGIDGGSNESD